MMSLDSSLRDVEHLYHNSLMKEDFFQEDDCPSKRLLHERLKKNLREVLCDLIILQKLKKEDAVLELESCS